MPPDPASVKVLARSAVDPAGRRYEIQVLDNGYFLSAQAEEGGRTVVEIRLSKALRADSVLPASLCGDDLEAAESLIEMVRGLLGEG